ncbi:MAG: tRNA lysidine(34) synthetase TilS [Planctomycetota bacterium]
MPDESKFNDGDDESSNQSSLHNSSHDPWQSFTEQLDGAWPATRWRDLGVVVGCSGGADSVSLVKALSMLRCRDAPSPRGFVMVAHFNHQLRGAASDSDQEFVQDLAEQLDFPFVCRPSADSLSDEAGMRRQRLDFLSETARRSGARYVALAHSADDNVETVLFNLVRGTGPKGLAGIPPYRSLHRDLVLIRPMLPIRRQLIRNALTTIGQAWREDASNTNLNYRRNWMRHQVIPLLEQQFPHAGDAVVRAIEGQQEWLQTLQSLANDWLSIHCCNESPVHLQRDSETPEAVLVLACQTLWDRSGWSRQEMNQSHWKRLAQAIRSTELLRFSLPGGIDVSSDNQSLRISP